MSQRHLPHVEREVFMVSAAGIPTLSRIYIPLSRIDCRACQVLISGFYRASGGERIKELLCSAREEDLVLTQPDVMHMDLKPGNIYLNQGPSIHTHSHVLEPLFLDFGASKVHPAFASTSGGSTAMYRAPKKNESPKSDVWSMGSCFTFIEA